MSCSSKRNRLVGSCISTLVSSTKSLAGPVLARLTGLARLLLSSLGAGGRALTAGRALGANKLGLGWGWALLANFSTGAICAGAGGEDLAAGALRAGFGLLTAKVVSKAEDSRRLARLVGALGSGMCGVLQAEVEG